MELLDGARSWRAAGAGPTAELTVRFGRVVLVCVDIYVGIAADAIDAREFGVEQAP